MRRAGLHDMRFGDVIVRIGWQTDAAGVDDQGLIGQLDDARGVRVTAQQDGQAGSAQPLFDLGRGSQPEAAMLDGLEQVGRVAGGGAVEQKELLIYLQAGGQTSRASSAPFHSDAGRRSDPRDRAARGLG